MMAILFCNVDPEEVLAGIGNLNGSVAGSADYLHDTLGPSFLNIIPFGLWPAICRKWDLENTVST